MTSKSKSLTKLLVAVIVIAIMAFVAFVGVSLGNNFAGGALNMEKSGIKLGFDLSGGSVITYEADTTSVSEGGMNTAINMLQTRLTNLGYTEATVTKQGDKRIRIEIPNVSNDEAIEKLGTPGKLTFRNGAGEVLMEGTDEYIKNASAQYDVELGNYVVLEFTAKGKDAFAAATSAVYGTSDPRLYIYLDETVQSYPTVEEVINSNSCQITGEFDATHAAWLANTIKEGQMPFSLILKSTSSVSATLGEKALSTSMMACGIGILLVLLFMLIFYRLPGFVADISLVAYISILLLILCEFEHITGSVINLTLPGIAGIVLGVGMAVDANVIIFERIKEELRVGKTVGAATEAGFKRAFTAILDGNVTTFIVAVILFIFGTGTIQGFAVTLGLGIIISLFTAVVVTRFLLKALIGLNVRNPKLYGASLKG
ncbi:MAG: protein translocase subunit SecD, partial [Clostridia bacterium]|nr:protein translocase subunit SecD [Clostridia bacterium]